MAKKNKIVKKYCYLMLRNKKILLFFLLILLGIGSLFVVRAVFFGRVPEIFVSEVKECKRNCDKKENGCKKDCGDNKDCQRDCRKEKNQCYDSCSNSSGSGGGSGCWCTKTCGFNDKDKWGQGHCNQDGGNAGDFLCCTEGAEPTEEQKGTQAVNGNESCDGVESCADKDYNDCDSLSTTGDCSGACSSDKPNKCRGEFDENKIWCCPNNVNTNGNNPPVNNPPPANLTCDGECVESSNQCSWPKRAVFVSEDCPYCCTKNLNYKQDVCDGGQNNCRSFDNVNPSDVNDSFCKTKGYQKLCNGNCDNFHNCSVYCCK